MAQDQERCDGCRFWGITELEPHNNLAGGQESALGRCRRYPPVRVKARTNETDFENGMEFDFPLTLDEEWCGEFQPASKAEDQYTPDQATKTPVENLAASKYTTNALKAAGIFYIEESQAMTDNQLRSKPNIGAKALQAIRAWRPTPPASPPPCGPLPHPETP